MHVYEPERKAVRRDRVSGFVQMALAIPAALCGLGAFVVAARGMDGLDLLYRGYFLALSLMGVVFAVLLWRESRRGFRAKARVILTERTLAIKLPRRPAVFLKREDCVAFGPLRCVFVRRDGTELDFHEFGPLVPHARALCEFVFARWWTMAGLQEVERGLEAALPVCRRRCRWRGR